MLRHQYCVNSVSTAHAFILLHGKTANQPDWKEADATEYTTTSKILCHMSSLAFRAVSLLYSCHIRSIHLLLGRYGWRITHCPRKKIVIFVFENLFQMSITILFDSKSVLITVWYFRLPNRILSKKRKYLVFKVLRINQFKALLNIPISMVKVLRPK